MLKIRRSLGRLIFNMGIAIPGKTVFLIETAPRLCFLKLFTILDFILVYDPVNLAAMVSRLTACQMITSLNLSAPGRSGSNFKSTILKLIMQNNSLELAEKSFSGEYHIIWLIRSQHRRHPAHYDVAVMLPFALRSTCQWYSVFRMWKLIICAKY